MYCSWCGLSCFVQRSPTTNKQANCFTNQKPDHQPDCPADGSAHSSTDGCAHSTADCSPDYESYFRPNQASNHVEAYHKSHRHE